MMDPGDSGCTHGLSKRIHDAMLAGSTGAIEGVALKAFAFALSTAIVAEIQANATAVVPSDGSVYTEVTNQSLGAMPSSTTPGTLIDSLTGTGHFAAYLPLGGANLKIQ